MECFVDFCEDAIFEMQHSASLIETEDGEGAVSLISMVCSKFNIF